MPKRISDAQAARIRSVVTTGGTKDEARAAAGVTVAELEAALLAGPLAGLRIGRRYRPPSPDPTPEEIELRTAELRSRWPITRWLDGIEIEARDDELDDDQDDDGL